MIQEGYVYLICGSDGEWKIGRTSDPKKRFRTFDVKLPFKIEINHTIRCYNTSKLERQLHHIFQHRRTSGEWFKLQFYEVSWIRQFESQVHFDDYCVNVNLDSVSRAKEALVRLGGLQKDRILLSAPIVTMFICMANMILPISIASNNTDKPVLFAIAFLFAVGFGWGMCLAVRDIWRNMLAA